MDCTMRGLKAVCNRIWKGSEERRLKIVSFFLMEKYRPIVYCSAGYVNEYIVNAATCI